MTATRKLLLELVADSVDVIGTEKADEFAGITDDAELITALIRYAILNDHDSKHTLLSPDLSDNLLNNRLPSANRCFIGRKEELKAVAKALQEHNLVFITGTAGMGKSELAKTFAKKSKKNTPNIYFAGNTLSADALNEVVELIGDQDFSINVISKSGTTTRDTHLGITFGSAGDYQSLCGSFFVAPRCLFAAAAHIYFRRCRSRR